MASIFTTMSTENRGFGEYERDGIFLNYVAFADIRYGGGQVTVVSPSPTVNPINLNESRPALLNNRIQFSAGAAIAGDPNSFEETRFTHPRYQLAELFTPDFERVGPDIRGNTLINNTNNGLFLRTITAPGQPLTTLEVAARLDDTDVTYTLGENLIISGTPGGPVLEQTAPDVSLVQLFDAAGGSLTIGDAIRYKVTAVDVFGAEGIPSAATAPITLGDTAVELRQLPSAAGEFVSRRLWRSTNGGDFVLVAELDGGLDYVCRPWRRPGCDSGKPQRDGNPTGENGRSAADRPGYHHQIVRQSDRSRNWSPVAGRGNGPTNPSCSPAGPMMPMVPAARSTPITMTGIRLRQSPQPVIGAASWRAICRRSVSTVF